MSGSPIGRVGSVVFGAAYTWHIAVGDGLIVALLQ